MHNVSRLVWVVICSRLSLPGTLGLRRCRLVSQPLHSMHWKGFRSALVIVLVVGGLAVGPWFVFSKLLIRLECSVNAETMFWSFLASSLRLSLSHASVLAVYAVGLRCFHLSVLGLRRLLGRYLVVGGTWMVCNGIRVGARRFRPRWFSLARLMSEICLPRWVCPFSPI